MHVHVYGQGGEAKFWIEPKVELAKNQGLSQRQLRLVETKVKEHEDEIRKAWQKHFPS